MLALYRPGPLEGGLVDQYIDTKHGRRKPEYLHPLLEPILKETYGVIVYQEQVMEIARAFAGYTLGEADLLRRAIGKKEEELMKKLRSDFVERSVERGIPREIAEKVFDLIEKFARYGFNKSHSAAYALIAYQTAYLKAHYPIYFMASILTYEADKSEEVCKYLSVAQEMGIKILPPDINKSGAGFTIEEGAIRIGLQAIKNVGEEAVQEVLRKKPYSSFVEFCQKVDTHKLNRKTIEALIKAGAFDGIEPNRAKLLHNLPAVLSFCNQSKLSGLFGQGALLQVSSAFKLEDVPDFALEEKLSFEKEALGFYLTDHPIKRLRSWIKVLNSYNTEKVKELDEGVKVILPGLISDLKLKNTRSGEKMAFFSIEDEFGAVRALMFPDAYKKHFSLVSAERPLWFKGVIDKGEDRLVLIVEEIRSIEDLGFFAEGVLELGLPHFKVNREFLEVLKDLLQREEGIKVRLKLIYPDCAVHFETNGLTFPLKKETLDYFTKEFPDISLRFSL